MALDNEKTQRQCAVRTDYLATFINMQFMAMGSYKRVTNAQIMKKIDRELDAEYKTYPYKIPFKEGGNKGDNQMSS